MNEPLPTESAGRVVVFDIGRVLVDFDVRRAIANLAAATGAEPQRVESALFSGDEYGAYSRGRLDAAGFHAAFVARCAPLAFDAFARAWCDMFSVMPAMDALAAEVAALAPIYLCSNTDPLHYEHLLATAPTLRLARGAVVSFEVGAEKPEDEMYEAVRTLVGAGEAPGRIVFVDDRPDNVEGARAAGFDALRFSDADSLRRALHARGLGVRLP